MIQLLYNYVCVQGYVSEVALDAAEAAAKIYPEVNSQRLFTRGRSAVDAKAPSEPQALNTPEHMHNSFLVHGNIQNRKYFELLKKSH